MKHFIEFVFAQTNQFFNSNPNVISTRRTCSQRSGMAAGSKRRVLAPEKERNNNLHVK